MSSRYSFDNKGHLYNVSRIMLEGEASINMTAYKAYSPIFLPYAVFDFSVGNRSLTNCAA